MVRWSPQLLRSSENDRIEGQASMIGSPVPGGAVSVQCLPGGSPMPGLEVLSSPRPFSELRRSWGDHRSISTMNYKHRTSFPGSYGIYTALGALLVAGWVSVTFLS